MPRCVEAVAERIAELLTQGAYHKKRGFRLDTADVRHITNHLLEEIVELQAEAFHGERTSQLAEAADVLLCYLHLVRQLQLPLAEITQKALQALQDNFVFSESEVPTDTPGFTRQNREPNE